MRAVAVDDALWYLHKQLIRGGGTGAGITGSLGGTSYSTPVIADTALKQVPEGYLIIGVDPHKKRHAAVACQI